MAKDRACARKTDGSPLCPGPASPRDPRDPFAFYVLNFLYAPYVLSLPAQYQTLRATLIGYSATRFETSAHIAGRCLHGCFSIAQLSQNVYLPGGICQKVCNCNQYFTYFLESFFHLLFPPWKYGILFLQNMHWEGGTPMERFRPAQPLFWGAGQLKKNICLFCTFPQNSRILCHKYGYSCDIPLPRRYCPSSAFIGS